MKIHLTQPGDTVHSVAHAYGISPTRLIEDNALTDPDRLIPGECLLILLPSRTHTVRGGDDFKGICRRYGIEAHRLLALNPVIGEKRELYPGQVIALGSSDPSRGAIAVCGYAPLGIDRDILHSSLSALTYLAIMEHPGRFESGRAAREEHELIEAARKNGVLPLLCFSEREGQGADLSAVSEKGYGGVVLTERASEDIEREARRAGLLTVREGNRSGCELCTLPFSDGKTFAERTSDAARRGDGCRTLVELPYHAADHCPTGATPLPLSSVPALARRRRTDIKRTPEGGSYLEYAEMRRGEMISHRVCFEDLLSIQKGLAVIGESGILGVALHLAFAPPVHRLQLAFQFDIIRHPLPQA